MQALSSTINAAKPRKSSAKKGLGAVAMVTVGGTLTLKDSFEEVAVKPLWKKVFRSRVSDQPDTTKASLAKEWGARGTALGASIGSLVGTPLALLAVWGAGPSLGLDPVTQIGVTAAATAASPFLRPGRLIAGTIGGVVGYVAGAIASKLGTEPNARLGEATKNFKLSQVPRRLLLSENSTPKISAQKEAKLALSQAKPGDILLAHKDGLQSLSTLTQLGGKDGSYTHVGMVGLDGQVYEIRTGAAEARDKKDWERFQKLAVVRPKYANQESIAKTDNALRELAQGAVYNLPFGIINSDDKKDQYCGKFVHQALSKGAPEIRLPNSEVLGLELALAQDFKNSPDVDIIYESGTTAKEYNLRRFS